MMLEMRVYIEKRDKTREIEQPRCVVYAAHRL